MDGMGWDGSTHRNNPHTKKQQKKLGVALPPLDSEEARAVLDALCVQHDVACGAPRTVARLLDKLVGEFLEVRRVGFFFVVDKGLL